HVAARDVHAVAERRVEREEVADQLAGLAVEHDDPRAAAAAGAHGDVVVPVAVDVGGRHVHPAAEPGLVGEEVAEDGAVGVHADDPRAAAGPGAGDDVAYAAVGDDHDRHGHAAGERSLV